ncbi:heterokaryon incompatibility protein-domain-containing protein [Leptodontidium sp. MPI-SDFR-AT-0119]|nr:heterokaryon incompatibility protein-domain-containing protein [Leptodontidium sp. MPI-SDFR-AT-0119]
MASRRVSWHGKIVEPLYRWKLSSPSWLKRYSFLGERAISSLAATDGGSYEENKLCPTCTKVISRVQAILQQPDAQIRAHREEIPYHFSIRKFLRSADGGCHLCSLFLGATWLEGRVKYSEARDHIMKNHAARKGKLKVELSGVGERTEWNSAYSPENALMKIDVSYLGSGIIHVVRNRSSQSEALQDDVPRQPLCASTGDFEAMHLASYWLKRCLQHHSVCDQAMRNTTKVRPCRLLRVRGEDGNEELNLIRLGEDQEDVQYLALSYSWGPQSANCVRLLISNIDAFCQEIDESTLPLTIRDAVKVTRSLGYQFLWVDSLCIIQDSREDWDSEAVKMGYIYRNAVLTIAGLGCSGNHESLFRNRNPLCDRPCGVPDTADVQISNTAHFFNREYELYGATAAPLHTRAWVVQERISSLRTLFFGESGMFWECAGCLACESDPQGTLEGDAVNFKHTINDVLNPSSDESTRYFAFRTLWKLVLEQYTSCNLTKQTDKLNAIQCSQ